MKKHLIYCIACTLLMSVYALPVFSWGQEGHRIIAKVAYDHLNAGTRKKVDRILGKQGIVYYANWPDEIKSDTIYPQSIKDGWHYQDSYPGMTDSAVIATLTNYPKEGGNLFRAMDSLVRVQRNDKRSAKALAQDPKAQDLLKFLVHLAGDRYCPMHIGHLDDRGGNEVKMKWFGKETRLHTVWDTKLIESQGYSYTEYAQYLEHKFGWKRKAIRNRTEEELLVQSYHLTEAIYAYQRTWNGNAYHYIYRWHEPMEEQLYIAGIRLAKMLNELY